MVVGIWHFLEVIKKIKSNVHECEKLQKMLVYLNYICVEKFSNIIIRCILLSHSLQMSRDFNLK